VIRRLRRGLIAAIAAGVCSSAGAHEAEHTAVSIAFERDGSFVLDVANDPNWLRLRLESFAALDGRVENPAQRENPAEPGPRGVAIARMQALGAIFIDRIVFFVDGHEVRPLSVEYIAPPPGSGGQAPAGVYRLRGRVPANSKILRWYYGMVLDGYPLAMTRADGRVYHEWIVAGDAWSRAIDLSGQFAEPTRLELARGYWSRGFGLILPRGAGHVLFVLGLLLLNLRARPIALQIAAFTLSSVAALWLTALGVMSISAAVTSPLLAASVAYVAIENLATSELKPWRLAAVFMFGLIHGSAFGRRVDELVLTRSELPAALAWITAGIETAVFAIAGLLLLALIAGSRTMAATRIEWRA
jgi:hypothetical protein